MKFWSSESEKLKKWRREKGADLGKWRRDKILVKWEERWLFAAEGRFEWVIYRAGCEEALSNQWKAFTCQTPPFPVLRFPVKRLLLANQSKALGCQTPFTLTPSQTDIAQCMGQWEGSVCCPNAFLFSAFAEIPVTWKAFDSETPSKCIILTISFKTE